MGVAEFRGGLVVNDLQHRFAAIDADEATVSKEARGRVIIPHCVLAGVGIRWEALSIMPIEFDTAEESDSSRQVVIGIVAEKRRHAVSSISGRMAHDIPIVDHSLTSDSDAPGSNSRRSVDFRRLRVSTFRGPICSW